MSSPLQRTDVTQYVATAVQQHDSIGLFDDQGRGGSIDSDSHGGSSVISSEDRHNSHSRASWPARVSNDGDTNELIRAYKRIKELTRAAAGRRSESKNKTRRCLKNLPPAIASI